MYKITFPETGLNLSLKKKVKIMLCWKNKQTTKKTPTHLINKLLDEVVANFFYLSEPPCDTLHQWHFTDLSWVSVSI